MAEYESAFAGKFAEIACAVVAAGLPDPESHRAVAYISRVSMELSLKAALEAAGYPVKTIRGMSHDFQKMLFALGACEVQIQIGTSGLHWASASRLRGRVVRFSGYETTVGAVLQAEDAGASRYPNELRYGGQPKDFPAEALAVSATELNRWVCEHIGAIRKT